MKILLVIPKREELKSARKMGEEMASTLKDFQIEEVEVSNLDKEEIANAVAKTYVTGQNIKATIILGVTGPLLLKELKKIFGIPFLSFDNVILSVVGRSPLARVVSVVSTFSEEKTLLTCKAVYEFIPNQIYILNSKDIGEIPQLYRRGYHIIIPCSAELVSKPELLDNLLKGLEGVSVENPLSYFKEEIYSLNLGKGKPSTYKIERILPCIADSSKIRFIAQLNANVEDLLPILYLHLKRSNYLEALDALTFTTDKEEMITIYGNGKVCAGKVKDENRAKEILLELIDLLSKAYDYLSRHGSPPAEMFEARRKLNPNIVYSYLPKLNCGKCGEKSCFTFAIKLISGEKKLSECKPLVEEEKYRKNREFLEKLFNPLL
ncbi:hypothetical protein DRO53_00665 [Candidatus Bathyarchaeota archaeon]|nr:MAG: hypothetical protein DRO53_00665 [Candidatus Bathyarchaeota archaeon]